jgi:CubicO group peptidase (beta-lactamase class C family)
VLLNQGYGSANLEWGMPNAPDTKFRLGSLAKQFTAASILLLEERGKLSTGDLVKKYVPDAPAAWDKMTIYEVLTHTAGIPNSPAFRTIARPNGRSRGHNLLIIKLIRARGTRTYIVSTLVGLSRQMHENTIGLPVIPTLALLAEVDPVARTES